MENRNKKKKYKGFGLIERVLHYIFQLIMYYKWKIILKIVVLNEHLCSKRINSFRQTVPLPK